MTHMGYHTFFSSSGVMQFREACYTVVSYAPYILLQIYTITILATFGVTIFEFFHPGPQPTVCFPKVKPKVNKNQEKQGPVTLLICFQMDTQYKNFKYPI